VQADFALTTENVAAVVEICGSLDGLPLAIELAAARVRLFAPAALLDGLADRLSLLTTGVRDAPVRHQSLRGAVAWSYDLLASAEQRLFERLAVFAGGCTLEAVEVVTNCNAELGIAALDGVAALVDQSLLRRLDGESDEPRFGFLETLREYALTRLAASGDEHITRERHALFCLALAEAAEPELKGSHQAEWLARLEREHDNLRAALCWWVQEEAEQAVRMGGALWRFWHVRGHLTEGRERLTKTSRGVRATMRRHAPCTKTPLRSRGSWGTDGGSPSRSHVSEMWLGSRATMGGPTR
jgi:predicted ATPase